MNRELKSASTKNWDIQLGETELSSVRSSESNRRTAGVRAASGKLTDLHLHLFRHHLSVEEERRGAFLITDLVEEVQDEVLALAVVAIQQLLEELGVCDAEGRVHAVAHPQHPQVVHGAAQGRMAPQEPSDPRRPLQPAASVATGAPATATGRASARSQGAPASAPALAAGQTGSRGGWRRGLSGPGPALALAPGEPSEAARQRARSRDAQREEAGQGPPERLCRGQPTADLGSASGDPLHPVRASHPGRP